MLLLVAVLLIGFGLRAGGLSWGVPKAPHYRNYYQDERFVLGLVLKMDPARLHLDPGYFINPTLHYYTLLKTLLVGKLFGLNLNLPETGDNPFKPDDMPGATYTALFVIGRWLVLAESLVSILLLFLIGRGLYNQKVGLFAALLLAVNYAAAYQSHFFTADAPALAWMILSLYCLVKLFRRPESKLWQVLAPVGIGLAVGAKYLNALMILPYLYVLYRKSPGTGDRVSGLGARIPKPGSRIPKRAGFFRRHVLRAVFGFGVIAVVFLITTPYALFSFNTFLRGNYQGFGGIFGERGLLFYNSFPPSITEPFLLTSMAALNIAGLLAFLLALVALFSRRKPADLLLLFFIVPFYLMLMYKSSPQLRHILPVLPFVFLACAAALSERTWLKFRTGIAGSLILGVVALSWFGLSLSGVLRMARQDTRLQAETWVRQNVTDEVIALPTYFPFRYTPAIDSFRLINLDYDLRKLEQVKPEYLLVTEPEVKISGRSDDKADVKAGFAFELARLKDYRPYRQFAEPFRLFGINLNPTFPTEDWSFPSPGITIYRRTQ